MSTSYLNFTKDPERDITTASSDYHNFNGNTVRIKVYWTTEIWQDFKLWSQSLHLIRFADALLRKYTLGLDVRPWGAPIAVHAAMRAKMADQFARAVGPKVNRALPESVRSVAGMILDQTIDDVATTVQGLIKFKGSISIPYQGQPAIGPIEELRKLIEPVTEQDRLIVVFVPLAGAADGYTVLFQPWLPWVLVDPRDFGSGSMLMHEIGHACRLKHEQEDMKLAEVTNLMYPLTHEQNQLWGWQVDTIFDSYWCSGRPPKDWWIRDPLHPSVFLWNETP